MSDFNLPPSGSLVYLKTPPRGSWATAGRIYRVTYAPSQRAGKRGIWGNSTVQLRDELRDCGTYDIAIAWRSAEWRIAAATSINS